MFKKNISKFTIQFDMRIPEHRKAVEMLNKLGRNKASLLARLLSTRIATSLISLYNESNEPKKNVPIASTKHSSNIGQAKEQFDTSIFDDKEEDAVTAYEPLVVENEDQVAENLKKLGIF